MCIRDRFITDYDGYVDGLYSKLGEYENLDELKMCIRDRSMRSSTLPTRRCMR